MVCREQWDTWHRGARREPASHNGDMERRRANRLNWNRVLERRFDVVYLQSPTFTGYVTRLFLDRVSEPLHKELLVLQRQIKAEAATLQYDGDGGDHDDGCGETAERD